MPPKVKVAVVVDSSTCLSLQVCEELGISVVPFELHIHDGVYRDGIDIEPAEFYRLLEQDQNLPTTAAPSPARFSQAFTTASKRANNILCLTLSSNFSATYNSALTAKEIVRDSLPAVTIRIIDTMTAAGAEGFLALEAGKAAREGLDLDQVTLIVKNLMDRVHLLAFLDTFEYVRKGGRIPTVAAWAGSLLRIKPLTELKHGHVRLLEKPRSRKKAIQRLLEILQHRAGTKALHVNVMHGNVLRDAQQLRTMIEQSCECREISITQFTPVMGAHTGPGMLGLAFYTEY